MELSFKIGTGYPVTEGKGIPGAFYVCKYEELDSEGASTGNFKWKLLIADEEGTLGEIQTPEEVKGLVYENEAGELVTITGEELATFMNEAGSKEEVESLDTRITSLENYYPVIDAHIEDKDNPHEVTAEQVGLGTVTEDIANLNTEITALKTADSNLENNLITAQNTINNINSRLSTAENTLAATTIIAEAAMPKSGGTFTGEVNFITTPTVNNKEVAIAEDVESQLTTITNAIGNTNSDLKTTNENLATTNSNLETTNANLAEVKTTADNALSRINGGVMEGPITIRILGTDENFAEGEAISKEYVDTVTTPMQNNISSLSQNKINKANDTFTGNTAFGSNTTGITTTFYGTQKFINNDTNFVNAPTIGTETITTVEYVDNHLATVNSTLEKHNGRITVLENGVEQLNTNLDTTNQNLAALDMAAANSDKALSDRIDILESKTQDITVDKDGVTTTVQTHDERILNAENAINDLTGKWNTFVADADATANAVDTLKEIQYELDQDQEGSMAATMLGEITKLKDGTTPAGKATSDANGNNIVNTYETKSSATFKYNNLSNQITAAVSEAIAYTDTEKVKYLPLAGGIMTGTLTLSGAPTSNLHAATKAYVDAVNAKFANYTTTSTLSANYATIEYVDSLIGDIEAAIDAVL